MDIIDIETSADLLLLVLMSEQNYLNRDQLIITESLVDRIVEKFAPNNILTSTDIFNLVYDKLNKELSNLPSL